jgi:hypothetical protein
VEAKLEANENALEEAKAQISAAETKCKNELEAMLRATEKAPVQAKAQTVCAEEALAKTETEQATREEGIHLRLKKLSISFTSKCYQYFVAIASRICLFVVLNHHL